MKNTTLMMVINFFQTGSGLFWLGSIGCGMAECNTAATIETTTVAIRKLVAFFGMTADNIPPRIQYPAAASAIDILSGV